MLPATASARACNVSEAVWLVRAASVDNVQRITNARSRTRPTTCLAIVPLVPWTTQADASFPTPINFVAFVSHFAVWERYSAKGPGSVLTEICNEEIAVPLCRTNSHAVLFASAWDTDIVTSPPSTPPAVAAFSQGQFSAYPVAGSNTPM